MTTVRVLELLHELRTLEMMAQQLGTFVCRADTRAAWDAVLVAIDDRCALLRGVLVLNVDAAVLAACELHLAQQPQDSDDFHDSQMAITENPHDVVKVPRLTIH